MPFWFLNKKENEPRIFGSISSICTHTDLKPDMLYSYFSRKKLDVFENEKYRIHKLPIEREAQAN